MGRLALALLVGIAAFCLSDPLKLSPINGIDFTPHALLQPPAVDLQALDPTNRLRAANVLSKGEIKGPESLAFDAQGRGPYAGLADGRIVRYLGSEVGWEEFAWTSSNKSAACGQAFTNEDFCGRPLGLRFHPQTGELYIADAYFGLMKVGPEGGLAKLVVNGAEGQRFMFTNDMDITKDGVIYFTDTTNKYRRRQFMLECLEGGGYGRLLKHDPSTGTTTVLLKGLHFANGVALAKDESFLLVVETTTAKVQKYWLQGPKAGTAETVASNLPGLPDNIRRNPEGHFWVALHTLRTRSWNFLQPLPKLRHALLRLPVKMPFWYLTMLGYPSGAVMKIDGDGKVLDVLLDRGGKVASAVSEVEEREGKLWMGSVIHPWLAVYTL